MNAPTQRPEAVKPSNTHGLSGTALAAYWKRLNRRRIELEDTRSNPPCAGGCSDELSHIKWRYELKIEIGIYEIIAARLHKIVAPTVDTGSLCGLACKHVQGGMTTEQVRAFIASLDNEIEKCERIVKGEPISQYWEDTLMERGLYTSARSDLVEAWTSDGGDPAALGVSGAAAPAAT